MLAKFLMILKSFFSSTKGSKTQNSTAPTVDQKEPAKPVSEKPQEDSLSLCEKFFNTANSQMGVHEIDGPASNKQIIDYAKSIGIHMVDDSSHAWCSIFACWVVEMCGLKSRRNQLAREWLKWGKAIDKPVKGCIVVFWRVSPNAETGHVAFYSHEDQYNVYVLGGNQSNQVKISPYPKERVLGYRIPS